MKWLMIIGAVCLLGCDTSEPELIADGVHLRFEIGSLSVVTLVIENAYGTEVKTLFDEDTLYAGSWSPFWDGVDDSGDRQVQGLYFARLSARTERKIYKAIHPVVVH